MEVDDKDLLGWLTTVGAAIRAKPSATKYSFEYGDFTAVIEISRKPSAAFLTAGYAIWEPRFYKLLYGEVPSDIGSAGAALFAHGGLVRSPFKALTFATRDKSEKARESFSEFIVDDAWAFFGKLTTLSELLGELTSSEPQFKYADPRAKHRRALHAAVVARLQGAEWRGMLEFAKTSPIEQKIGWIEGIERRLEAYHAAMT